METDSVAESNHLYWPFIPPNAFRYNNKNRIIKMKKISKSFRQQTQTYHLSVDMTTIYICPLGESAVAGG